MRTIALGLVLVGLAIGPAQAATLLPNAEQQFIDANGAPYAGGQTCFYVPSTLTPKQTWQNSGQTITNTSPCVTLDSAGRAIVYGNGVYRQILKDSSGNTIWDQLTQGYGSGGVVVNTPITGSGSVASCTGIFPINNQAVAPITLTMPTGPSDGDSCTFVDAGANASSYTITLNFGSKSLNSGGTTYPMTASAEGETFTWSATLALWLVD